MIRNFENKSRDRVYYGIFLINIIKVILTD